jgi:hypothetical protein
MNSHRLKAYYTRVVPCLTCAVCTRQTVLPSRTLVGASLPDPYWPDEDEELTLVCDRCRHLQAFRRDDIMWAALPKAPNDRGFWRVEIPCSEPRCSAGIVAHIQTYGKTSRSLIGTAIAGAMPTPVCRFAHHPASVPYPKQIDFVEWSGGMEYVF